MSTGWIITIVVLSVLLLIALILFLLFFFQERLIFQAEEVPEDYQFEFNLPFEEIYFQPRRGVRLNSVLFKAKDSKGLVLFFHGHSGSIATWGYVAEEIVKIGWDCLVYDFRGYGKSSGKHRTEISLHKDAEFIFEVMKERYSENDMIFVGQSLGSGIATKLATLHTPRTLLLITPYFNFTDVVHFHYPFLPARMMLKYQFATNKLITEVACPVFLIHGTKDQLVPFESSIRLSSLSENIRLTTVQGGEHGNLQTYSEYETLFREILA
jgi:pimeloyl-ACP methyl ester carboxylesterase